MIRRSLCLSLFAGLAFMAFVPVVRAITATNSVSEFKEVYDLIHSHLAGVSDAELDQAAVAGLLTAFDGRVSLDGTDAMVSTNGFLTSRAAMLDGGVGFIRINRVNDGLAQELGRVWRNLSSTNELKGLVLDLRFARGINYAAAAAAADLFMAHERLLLDYGDGKSHSTSKTNAVTLPLAVLVNHFTSGSAEALAAVLRESGAAIILGETTAGRAMVMQEYPLKNGQHLSIASKSIKLGDGTVLSISGVKPDIQVPVSAEAAKTYFDDPYAALSVSRLSIDTAQNNRSGETNRVMRHVRLSEADLVREKREGVNSDDDSKMSLPAEPEQPGIHDPVLARAVDLLKALALVRDQRN